MGLWLLWWERLRNQITGRRWLQFWDSPLGGWAVRLAGVGLARLPVGPTPGEPAPPPAAALPGPAAERAELPEVVERTRTCVRRIQAWREDTSSRRAAQGRSPTPDEQTLERDLDGKLEELEALLGRLSGLESATAAAEGLTRDMAAACAVCDAVDAMIEAEEWRL